MHHLIPYSCVVCTLPFALIPATKRHSNHKHEHSVWNTPSDEGIRCSTWQLHSLPSFFLLPRKCHRSNAISRSSAHFSCCSLHSLKSDPSLGYWILQQRIKRLHGLFPEHTAFSIQCRSQTHIHKHILSLSCLRRRNSFLFDAEDAAHHPPFLSSHCLTHTILFRRYCLLPLRTLFKLLPDESADISVERIERQEKHHSTPQTHRLHTFDSRWGTLFLFFFPFFSLLFIVQQQASWRDSFLSFDSLLLLLLTRHQRAWNPVQLHHFSLDFASEEEERERNESDESVRQ